MPPMPELEKCLDAVLNRTGLLGAKASRYLANWPQSHTQLAIMGNGRYGRRRLELPIVLR